MSEWKEIPGYEGLYTINKKGEVMSLRTGRRVKPYKMYDKCKMVCLYKDSIPFNMAVTHLMQYTFG